MTERKPSGMGFSSWIDQQISEATDRGAFDDLPGAGKPLPDRGEFDGQAWVRDYVRREGGSVSDCLPTPLRLRRETERLVETITDFRSEQDVRDVVANLNEQIMNWRRLPVGPPLFVPLVDADALVAEWQQAYPPESAPDPADAMVRPDAAGPRPSWWRAIGRARRRS